MQKVITVSDELMEEVTFQLLGGGGIDFHEEIRFQGSPKGERGRQPDLLG